MPSRVLAWVLLCVGLLAASTASVSATQSKAAPKAQAKQAARGIECSFVPLTAKVLGIPVCPGTEPDLQMVADTIPGTAGFPSSQVITVQGCSGCISTSSGGGGSTFPYTGVSASAFGQTGTSASVVGIAGFDYANSNMDAILVAPFAGNSSGTGFPAAYGQPGVQVIQGGYQGGGILTFGETQVYSLPFTAATSQPLPGPTSTSTPVPNSGFAGVGGSDYSAGAASDFNPLKVNNAGQVTAIFPSAQPVTFPSAQPVTFPSAQPVTIASTAPVTFPSAQPVTIASTAPVTLPTSSPGGSAAVNPIFYGTGAAYVGAYPDTTTTSSAITSAATTQVLAAVAGQSIYVFWAGMINTGANASSAFYYEAGSGTACATNTVTLWEGNTGDLGTAAGFIQPAWAGVSVTSATSVGMVPSSVPYALPAGDAICIVSSGTTIAYKAVIVTAQH